jgi:uncharacterized delta-60 repeat protein
MRVLHTLLLALLSGMVLAQQPGTLDPAFNPSDAGFGLGDGTNGGAVFAMARQPDGKVIIAGQFGWHNGNIVGSVSRMNADGTRDASFQIGQIVDGQVFAVALQADGRILLGGNFSLVNGVPRYRIARLNANGSLDTSFDPGTGPSTETTIYALAAQADGTVVIGGSFQAIGGVPRQNIARLLSNGGVDPNFDPGTGAAGQVYALLSTSFGRLLVGGAFTAYNGVPRGGFARVNSIGALDLNFATGTGSDGGNIASIVERTDGRICVGGNFALFDGLQRRCTARLLATGEVDASYGSDNGPDVLTNPYNVRSLVEQADGSLLVGGHFTSIGGTPKPYLAKLSNTGVLMPSYPLGSGPSASVHAIILRPDGKAIVGGEFRFFGELTALGYMQLNSDGSLDTGFNPGSGFNGGFVNKLVVQPDQRILALGTFSGYNGTKRPNLLRLLAGGTLDISFTPDPPAGLTNMALLSDGKLLVAGSFTSVAGHATSRVARLNADGSVDVAFTASGLDNTVLCLAVQPDGKVLIAGGFTTVQGSSRIRIARLLVDGSLDPTFNPGTGANNIVHDLQLQPDGKVILVGAFTVFNGTARNRVVRLNADGSLDSAFDPGSGASATVNNAVLLPTGKLMVRGSFTTYNGIARTTIARLNVDGSLDQTFAPGTVSTDVRAVVPCPDGRIVLAGGPFFGVGGTTIYGLGRLLPDGSIDPSFTEGTGLDRSATSAVLTSTGQLVVAGDFFSYNGAGRNRIARINNGLTPLTTVKPRLVLDGPFSTTNSLMNDQLRAQQLLPLTEPYSSLGYVHVGGGGGEAVVQLLLSTGGANAIVDWVVVELRDALEPGTVLTTRSALLQRDGDVVGTNGVSPVAFTLPAGSYRVAVRHRNHLGCMTASPIALSTTPIIIDFTSSATSTYGTEARKNNNGILTLWPGDANFNGQVKYTGPNNDRDVVLTAVGGSTPTNVASNVYSGADVNLDGVVKYVGPNNDRDIILQTIGGTVPTAVRTQQLP